MTRRLLRVRPLTLAGLALEVVVGVWLSVLIVIPPDPPPEPTPVMALCRRTDSLCPRIVDGIRNDMEDLDQ